MGEGLEPHAQQDEPQAEQPQEGYMWREPISEERQAEVRGYLDTWDHEQDHDERTGPFDGVPLTGADVFWLAERLRDRGGWVPDLHLAGADLAGADLAGADLGAAHLEGAVLTHAHLEGAVLTHAHLEGADLGAARLGGANLTSAHLERATLRVACLEGATLAHAHLEQADLKGAMLDSKTVLTNAMLDAATRLGDIQWSGVGAVNLTQIDWDCVPRLGDDTTLKRGARAHEVQAAVRAYRQLAVQLRANGLSEVADRFAERAQVCQRRRTFRQVLADWRRPWRLPGDLVRWLFSWFLALLAGYSYRPGRSVFWYLATIGGFAFAYYQATHSVITLGLPRSEIQPLQWYEALVLSVSSFHGRGFFQPVQSLGDPVAILAAAEAIIGLLIEISFIAIFTQRFFGAK